jgi:hypothetical protein
MKEGAKSHTMFEVEGGQKVENDTKAVKIGGCEVEGTTKCSQTLADTISTILHKWPLKPPY